MICVVSQLSLHIFKLHSVSQLSMGLSSLNCQLKLSTLTLTPLQSACLEREPSAPASNTRAARHAPGRQRPARPRGVAGSSLAPTPPGQLRPGAPGSAEDTPGHHVTGNAQVIPHANNAAKTGSKLLVKNTVLVLSVL